MRRLICLFAVVLLSAATSVTAQDDGKPLIDLARMRSAISVGDTVGNLKGGWTCKSEEKLLWTMGSEAALRDGAYQRLFRAALRDTGYRTPASTTDLFDTRSTNPDVLVGAVVDDFRVSGCRQPYGSFDHLGMKYSMSVEWQVYSPVDDRTIARVYTHAGGEMNGSAYGNEVMRAAFRANAEQFAGTEDLRKAMAALGRPAAEAGPTAAPALAPLALPMAPAERATTFAEAAKAVVSIFTGSGFGSGFLISPDGYILTNQHVAGDGGQVRVRWPDGTDTAGEVVRADKRRDVALVKTTPPKSAALVLRSAPVELGETVYAIGTPLEKEFAGTLTRGVVSAQRRELQGEAFIQSDVAIDHGNSGGPLLDDKARVVGLADLIYERDGVSHNINFFIPIDEALRVLRLAAAGARPPEPAAAAPPPAAAARSPAPRRR